MTQVKSLFTAARQVCHMFSPPYQNFVIYVFVQRFYIHTLCGCCVSSNSKVHLFFIPWVLSLFVFAFFLLVMPLRATAAQKTPATLVFVYLVFACLCFLYLLCENSCTDALTRIRIRIRIVVFISSCSCLYP